jgi:hypothetical protein
MKTIDFTDIFISHLSTKKNKKKFTVIQFVTIKTMIHQKKYIKTNNIYL